MIKRRRLICSKNLGSEIRHKSRSVENHSPDSPSSVQLPVLVVFLTQLILFLHLSCFLASTSLPRPLLTLQDAVAQLSPLAEWSLGSCGLRLITEIENSLNHTERFVSAHKHNVTRDNRWDTRQRGKVSGPERHM
jgi:hypothetical protein